MRVRTVVCSEGRYGSCWVSYAPSPIRIIPRHLLHSSTAIGYGCGAYSMGDEQRPSIRNISRGGSQIRQSQSRQYRPLHTEVQPTSASKPLRVRNSARAEANGAAAALYGIYGFESSEQDEIDYFSSRAKSSCPAPHARRCYLGKSRE